MTNKTPLTDAEIRRQSSGVRLLVLEILRDGGEQDSDEIFNQWMSRRPHITKRHAERLPRMIAQLLWSLANLEWVSTDGTRYRLTAAGRQVSERQRGG